MTMVDSRRHDGGKPQAGNDGKRPYEAPRIVHTEQVETLAGTCDTSGGGKDTGQVSCNVFRS